MNPRRSILLSLVFVVFLAGSAFDIVTGEEHWPFSPYPMFSGVWTAPTFTWLRLYGVTADGGEFPLEANRYMAPFDQSRLPKAFKRMLARPDGVARARTALADCLRRYRELGAAGVHDGPPIAALRLYEVEWTIEPDAGNVEHPDRRTLVAEVGRP